MKVGNKEIVILYWLLDTRDRAGWLPIPILCTLSGLSCTEVKKVVLQMEKAGFVEAYVDSRLVEDAKYKYRLTPTGLAFIQEILRTPQKSGLIHKPLKPR